MKKRIKSISTIALALGLSLTFATTTVQAQEVETQVQEEKTQVEEVEIQAEELLSEELYTEESQVEEGAEVISESVDTPAACSVTDSFGFVYSDVSKSILTGYTGSSTNITIPNGVTTISEAFSSNKNIVVVTIPSTVTTIGYNAFADCTSLTTVNFGSGVTYIGKNAFNGCSALNAVNLPNKILSIGDAAFYNVSSATTLSLGNSLVSLGNYAFHGMSSITNVTLPSTLTTIGIGAFRDCSSLASIVVPDSVKTLQSDVFQRCISLKSAKLGDGITTLPQNLFEGCRALTSIEFPVALTEVKDSVFSGCTSLTKMVLPSTVTEVPSSAFSYCTGLSYLEIPATVTKIGGNSIPNTLTIYCYAGSYAYRYAVQYGYNYVILNVPTPTGVTASSYGKNATLIKYTANPNVEGYLIYGKRSSTGTYNYIGMTYNNYFVDTKALDSDYNFYWVYGFRYDENGKMVVSGFDKYVYAKGVTTAVTNLKASSKTTGVQLTWSAVSGAEGYLVYGIRPDGKGYGYIGMTTQGTTFTDTKALKVTNQYNYYWVFPYHKNSSGKMITGSVTGYTYGNPLK